MHPFLSGLKDQIRLMVIGLLKAPRVILPLIVLAVLYSIFHRTMHQFIDETVKIAAFITLISYGFFISRWSLFGRPKFSVHIPLLLIVYLPIVIAWTTLIYWGILIALCDSYIWLEHLSPPRSFFVATIGVLVIVIGYALFLFRLHARFFFGLNEAIGGLFIALRNIPANADPVLWSSDTFLVIMTAGIFLVVRGFDNMHTGWGSEPRDAILKSIDKSEYGALLRSTWDSD